MTINTDVLIRHFSFVIPTEIERHHHSSVSASILFTYHRCSRFPFCIFDFDAMIYGSPISSKHLFSMFFPGVCPVLFNALLFFFAVLGITDIRHKSSNTFSANTSCSSESMPSSLPRYSSQSVAISSRCRV